MLGASGPLAKSVNQVQAGDMAGMRSKNSAQQLHETVLMPALQDQIDQFAQRRESRVWIAFVQAVFGEAVERLKIIRRLPITPGRQGRSLVHPLAMEINIEEQPLRFAMGLQFRGVSQKVFRLIPMLALGG